MATAELNGNRVTVEVSAAGTNLRLEMSLQRHHYRYCARGEAAAVNSLLYGSVEEEAVRAEGEEVGAQMEAILKRMKGRFEALFGEKLTTKSGRTYLVDNSGLSPSQPPNHYFVTGGQSVWERMSALDYAAASAIRRVEEAIAARRKGGDKLDYLDIKAVHELSHSPGGRDNPVIYAYNEAHGLLGRVPHADAQLTAVSGQGGIVKVARGYY